MHYFFFLIFKCNQNGNERRSIKYMEHVAYKNNQNQVGNLEDDITNKVK